MEITYIEAITSDQKRPGDLKLRFEGLVDGEKRVY